VKYRISNMESFRAGYFVIVSSASCKHGGVFAVMPTSTQTSLSRVPWRTSHLPNQEAQKVGTLNYVTARFFICVSTSYPRSADITYCGQLQIYFPGSNLPGFPEYRNSIEYDFPAFRFFPMSFVVKLHGTPDDYIQKVTRNVQSVSRQSKNIYWHTELCSRRPCSV
jgi:hypothetical protein